MVGAPSVPEFKTDKIATLNDILYVVIRILYTNFFIYFFACTAKLITFFKACEENFQEIGAGIYILPNYTINTL